MILCLDVGNSQIYGGLYIDGELDFQFRKISAEGVTSDELGLFLRSVLRENGHDPKQVKSVAYCSVVPSINYSLKNCIKRYFDIEPFSVGPGAKCGLKIRYRNPLEVGADRIATAIAAVDKYPNQNVIVVDFGTATTFCAVTKDKDYLGGAIVPGLKISMQALEARTSKLPTVEIVQPGDACGKSTVESIQSGLFYGHLGTVREITTRITQESFNGEPTCIIGTGGFAGMFAETGIFDEVISDLVLTGIYKSLIMNKDK